VPAIPQLGGQVRSKIRARLQQRRVPDSDKRAPTTQPAAPTTTSTASSSALTCGLRCPERRPLIARPRASQKWRVTRPNGLSATEAGFRVAIALA
jgi:hypothetical protein